MSDPKPVLTPLDGWDCPECHMGPALSALRAEIERLTAIIQALEDPHRAALDAARQKEQSK